jgi:cytosine/uracil/thiamine/allantoin permease
MAPELSKGIQTMLMISGYGVCLFMGALCLVLLLKIWRNEIDLSTLLQEANGDASMSRFQLLIFTLVVAISLFILVERSTAMLPSFPTIPDGVLWLLGISGSTYAVGKGISFSRAEGVTKPGSSTEKIETVDAMSSEGEVVAAKVVQRETSLSSQKGTEQS